MSQIFNMIIKYNIQLQLIPFHSEDYFSNFIGYVICAINMQELISYSNGILWLYPIS